jgi:hypothetical protein
MKGAVMKRINLFLMVMVLFGALAWLPACNSTDVSGPEVPDIETREQNPDLDDPYGGYNVADEAPGFGDPAMIEEFGDAATVDYDDPMNADPLVANIMSRPMAQHFLMITWGNLERDSTVDFVTEWSGSLTVDPGVILLKRVVRFENHDRILPRERRDLLEWISFTQPAFDGIIVRVFPVQQRAATDVKDTTAVVTFSTGPLTKSFTIDELRDIDLVIPVDDAGNAVAFNSIVIPIGGCPSGFLGGIWADNPDTTGGSFKGMWMSEKGHAMGFLMGHYGVNSEGNRVFFGKWISLSGEFRGLIKGRYGSFPNAPGGFFQGVYLGRSLRVRGDLKGIWQTSDKIEGGGFFKGRWAARCPTLVKP